MNLFRVLETGFYLFYLLIVLGVLTQYTNSSLFQQSSQRRSTFTSRINKAIWNVIYIGTGNILFQCILPKLSLNLEASFQGIPLFDIYKTGLYLWILFIITPLFGELIFYILNGFGNKGARLISYLMNLLRGSSKKET